MKKKPKKWEAVRTFTYKGRTFPLPEVDANSKISINEFFLKVLLPASMLNATRRKRKRLNLTI